MAVSCAPRYVNGVDRWDPYSPLGDALGDADSDADADADADGDAEVEPEAEGSTELEAGVDGSGMIVGSGMRRDGMPSTARTKTRTKMAMTVRIQVRARRSSRVGSAPRYPGSLRPGSGRGVWLVMRRVRLQVSVM